MNITKNITTLALLGLTITPVLSNSNDALRNNLNSNFILTKIAHANEPASNIDSLTETAHTPIYHLETAQGWSNDLQTINWNEKGGYYDIYFLHSIDGATNPFGENGQDWYHCTTKDFVHYNVQNTAISSNVKNSMSDNDQSWESAWTGSVVQNQGNIAGVPKGDYVAYFSGLKKADGSQNIWAAWSDDNGRTFSHVLNNGNPVLPYNASFASNDKDNERDAYVCYWNSKMLMYCAEGDKIGVYQSKDGVNWSKADSAGASKVLPSTFMKGVNWTDDNKPIECPCLKMMTTPDGQTKAVLFYGDKTPQDGQTTGTYYVVGHLDSNGLFAADTNAKRLDLGSDYYGSNFSRTDDLNKPQSSLYTMGWVGNWSYTSQGVHNSQDGTGPYTGRLGSYTLARKLTLNNDLTLSSNIEDSNLHLTNTNNFNNVTKDKPATKDGKLNVLGQDADYGSIYTLADIPNIPANGEYDLHFTNPDGYKGRIYIDIWQGADYVKLNFDPTNNNFRVAGKATELNDDLSGTAASSAYYDGMLGNGNGYAEHLDSNETCSKDFHLKVFTDKDSVEFQFPNGQTYTVARYAINDNQDFKVYTQDPTGKNTMNLSVNTVDTLSNNSSTDKPADSSSSSAATSNSETKPSSSNSNTTNKPSNSSNTDDNKASSDKPTTGTSTSEDKSSSNNNSNTDNNKPVTSDSSKSSSDNTTKPSNSSNKPVSTTSSSKSDANKTTSTSSSKTNTDKSSSNSTTSKTSTSVKPSNSSETDSSNKSSVNSISKSNTNKVSSSSVKPDDNKSTVTSSDNKLSSSSNKSSDTANKNDNELAKSSSNKSSVSSIKNNNSKVESKTSNVTDSSKKSSMNSEIDSVKSSSFSESSKHSDDAKTESDKSSNSSLNMSSENNSSVKAEVSSESSSLNNNENKADNISAESNNKANNESGEVSQESSSITENQNAVNNNNNTLFSNQNASGNNAVTPETSTTTTTTTSTSPDDTYSPQKAEMLAKTNAKAEQGGFIAAIGAFIAMVAGWFGLKKKKD